MYYSFSQSLLSYNSFGISVTARNFFSIASESDLVKLFTEKQYREILDAAPGFMVIGLGTNLLFTHDYPGVIIKNDLKGIELVKEDDNNVIVRVAAGVVWHEFVQYAIDKNWGGIENLSLIPGTVGAAPVQNIGAYGVEVGELIDHVHAFDTELCEWVNFDRAACRFGYRQSFFKTGAGKKYIIASVTFKLDKQHRIHCDYGAIRSVLESKKITEPNIRDVAEAVIAIRRSKLPDPAVLGNAGSFFKNPVVDQRQLSTLIELHPDLPYYPFGADYKLPAGWLIEKAGWKGYRHQQVGCYEKQALILVNFGGATGQDLLALSLQIQQSVESQFGIHLYSEVNIVG